MSVAAQAMLLGAGVGLAGVGVGRWVSNACDGWVRWAVGMGVVLGVLVVGGWWLAWSGVAGCVGLWAGAVLGVGSVLGLMEVGRRWQGGGEERGDAWVLLGVVVLAGVLRGGLVATWTLPPGWDPSFHLLLASRVVGTGGLIATWEPYEPIALNYPLGVHVLVAAWGTPSETFMALLAVLGSVLVVQTAAVSRVLGLPGPAVVLSGVVMGWGAWMGSLGYLGWGGLPNLMGVCLMMGVLLGVMTAGRLGVMPGVGMAVMVGGMVLAHHHVMVSGGVAMLAAVVAGRRLEMLPWGATGLVMSAGGWGRLVGRAGQVGETAIHTYAEELLTPGRLAEELGWAMAVGLVLSVLLGRSEGHGGLRRGVYLAPLVVLVGLWVVLDYGCRVLAWGIGVETFTVLTPSRFLTNAVPLLAVLVGAGWAMVVGRWGVGGVVLAGVICAGAMAERYRYLWRVDPVPGAWRAAAAWVAAKAPGDVLVLNGPTVHPGAQAWLSFLTQRPTTYTPIPTSEPLGRLPSVETKLAAAGEVWDLRELRWVNPVVHEVLHVTADEGGGGAVAVSRVRAAASQLSDPSMSQP